jgi:hypothetical protein
MKRIVSFLMVLAVFFFQTASASGPTATISGPAPAIAGIYMPGTSTLITYTLTNNVPKSLPITVSGIFAPISRVPVPGDCGGALPAGPASCKIGIQLAPQSNHAGQAIHQTLSVNYQSRTPLTSLINFSIASAPPIPPIFPILTAVGGRLSFPLLVVSTTGGSSWATVSTIAGLPAGGGLFNASSCTGSGSSAICTAAGQDFTGVSSAPILVVSTNGGASWAVPTIAGLPASGFFAAASCTGSGPSAICTAAGEDYTVGQPPLLVVSTNGGVSWGVPTITGLPAYGTFYASSCTGSGPSAICTAAGQDSTDAPILVVSINGGVSWGVPTIAGLPAEGTFYASSCTGKWAQRYLYRCR